MCMGHGFYRQSREVVMNSEEQTLIDGLFTRLQQAEMDAAPRDVQAQERIEPASGPSACGGLLHDSGDSCARGRAQAARPAEQAVAGRARTGSGRACTSACQRWFFCPACLVAVIVQQHPHQPLPPRAAGVTGHRRHHQRLPIRLRRPRRRLRLLRVAASLAAP